MTGYTRQRRMSFNQKDDKPLTMKERFEALGQLPPFFRLIWQTSKSITVANAVLRIVRAVIPVTMLYIGKLIIDEVVLQAQAAEADLSYLTTLVLAEFGLAIISDVLNRATSLFDTLLGDLFANKTSIQLMEHAAKMDLFQFEDSNFYDKLERARRQTMGRTVLLSQVMGQVQDIITMVFLAVGLIAFKPWLILLLIVAVLPAFLGESHFNERVYSLTRSWTPERRELDYLRYTGASDETAKEIKMFGLANFLTTRFSTLADKYYEANRKINIRRSIWGTIFAAIGSAGYYAAYAIIIIDTVNGNITLGTLTFLSGSFQRLRGLLESVLGRFNMVAEGALYLKDFFDFFRMKPSIARPEKPVPFPQPIREGFVFENVGFKYMNSEKWAVRGLNFHLRAGEKLALVGENGAGKTTLVKLLARLYDPSEGRILLDDTDLRHYDPTELRKEIGVIFQDFVRYQLTAADNIAIGRIEERDNRSKIEESARLSLADKVIEKLPDKYEQIVGRRFLKGVDLSGGEWQKVALGRAYMRNAQLLILDEPTAALDARAEHEVFQRFARLTQGKSAVLISHRFSTVRMADRILVLQGGKVLELGSHEELLEKDGKYAELFHLQAEGYR
ncbi:ABC transporter ATP-binding protein [Roseivirga sp. BDSF3-8]|uniref:ABC transporter ATP-binding protein n=1 Tax=Roseivirga sp. BDSF3-8 TaxID=3241598 RepID=UPI003531EB90